MKYIFLYTLFSSLVLLFCNIQKAQAQQRVEGNVYDHSRFRPVPNVKVLSSSGHYALTDSSGRYSIVVKPDKDTIWFNYEGKNTVKYPIDTVRFAMQFDIGLNITLPQSANWLPPVSVRTNSYYMDSLGNRKDYAKIFNPDKGGFKLTTPDQNQGIGVGVDLDALINSFRFGYNKRQTMYQNRILEEERYNYVNHRFTPELVADITGLGGKQLENFMNLYRPEYNALTLMNDLDLAKYIGICAKKFKERAKPRIYNNPFQKESGDN